MKRDEDRGLYIHPKEYGLGEEFGIEYQIQQRASLGKDAVSREVSR